MTLILDDDYCELSWTQLREAMEHDETLRCQLMGDKGNVDELRHELRDERADLSDCLDTIAEDWTAIRWRLASIVLLERVPDLEEFRKVACRAMSDDLAAVTRLVELLEGVDEVERAYWKKLMVERGKAGCTKTITLPCGAVMEVVWCPATTDDEWKSISGGQDYFMMGSPVNEEGREDNETPHRVKLTKGYWLGKYEVTQAQWRSVMGTNPSKNVGDDLPVENVSWEMCDEFCRRIGIKARFPSEAEWEYACRAGTSTAYCWGNALNGDKANCDGNYPCGTTVTGRYLGQTTGVGAYPPNAWGFYDMHGNVLEWCQDWIGDYGDDVTTDPTGPDSGPGRVLRGGSWYNSAKFCRSACRTFAGQRDRRKRYGFRLCFSADAI